MQKRIFVASAFTLLLLAMGGQAQAQTASTILDPVDSGQIIEGYRMPVVAGSATFGVSTMWVSAQDISGIELSATEPATAWSNDNTAPYRGVDLPVARLESSFDPDNLQLTLNRAALDGGMTLTASGMRADGQRTNPATTGGSLTLSNIQVDFTTKGIYADLTGLNNIGIKRNQLVWNYANLEGARSTSLSPCLPMPEPLCENPASISDLKITGLTITDQSFGLFAQALGLSTQLGIPAMRIVSDYGSITFSAAVPEPASVLLMGLGLLAVGVAGRRGGQGKAEHAAQR